MQTDLLWQSEDKMGAGACSMGMRLVCCWVGGRLRSRRGNSGLKAKSLFVSVAATCEHSTYMCGLVPESDTPKEEHYGHLSNGIYSALHVPLLLLLFVPLLPARYTLFCSIISLACILTTHLSPSSPPASKYALLNSTVSSKMLGAVARAEGIHHEETLTGFKWMGNRTEQLAKEGIEVIFAYEEAIGEQ